MDAAQPSGTDATQPTIRLRADVFDELASKQGATNEIERARLVAVDRTTLYRIRECKVTPTLKVAMQMAERLGVGVNDLFEVAA